MEIEAARHISELVNELDELKSQIHGIWKSMLPQEVIIKRVEEWEARVEEIEAEIKNL